VPVNRLKKWLLRAFFGIVLTVSSGAQVLESADGKPPVFGIVDESGFFNRESGALKRVSDQLRTLEADHGYKIYLVVEPVLIAGSAPERAGELFQKWLPEGNGLVIVFEADSRRLGVGRDMAGIPAQSDNPARVPSHETNAILNRTLESVDSALAPEAYLEAVVAKLTTEFDSYFKRLDTPPPPQRSMRIGLLVIGTLSLLGLAAIALGGFVRHSGMARVRSFRFPLVDRPERLGAPCGGGVTARRFRTAGKNGG
jgi:hypothetical protein